jgi:hypothetical protein
VRYLLVRATGGLIQDARPFEDLKEASEEADKVSEDLDPESDDVVVLDLTVPWQDEQRVYQPLSEK